MTPFEIVVLILGLAVGSIAGGVTALSIFQERQNREKSRELLRLNQERANVKHESNSAASSDDIGKMIDDLTIRDYESNPELAKQIDDHFTGLKRRKDVRSDE